LHLTPLIFLDVDGVINDHKTKGAYPFDPVMLERVCSLADETQSKIVISSTWRKAHDREGMTNIFGDRLGNLLADEWKTGNCKAGFRGNEVFDYLDLYGWRPYVIIDDSCDFYSWQHTVRTESYVGVLDEHIEAAKVLLTLPAYRHGLRYKLGNLMQAPELVIAHGCNAMGAMGSGVAKAVIDTYPANYKTYRDKFNHSGLKLGSVVWHVEGGEDGKGLKKAIANAITQPTFGTPGVQHVDYDAVKRSMATVAAMVQPNEAEVGIPRIGADLGGGDWNIIANIINDIGTTFNVLFTVYIMDSHIYANCLKTVREQEAIRTRPPTKH